MYIGFWTPDVGLVARRVGPMSSVREEWRRRKHAGRSQSDVIDTQQDAACWRAACVPVHSGNGVVYDMDSEIDQERLAKDIWTLPFEKSLFDLRAANHELVTVLTCAIQNRSDVTESLIENKLRLIDGLLLNICRAQSQKKMPLLTVGLSIMGDANHLTRELHDLLTLHFKGALASEKWTKDLMKIARNHRPPPSDPVLEGVVVATFDNLSMQVDYSSYVREGEGGHRLDMTNWFSTTIPRWLAGRHFDAAQIFKRGIFRTDLSLGAFCRLFYLDDPEILSNRRRRWHCFLRAAANGRLLERPHVPPRWQPYKIYQPPMFGRLQSSYEDVEYELTEITTVCKSSKLLFVAGDGLALMRINSLLKYKTDKYIDQTPCVIPIQGEHPHGLFHIMHGQWRLHRQFIMWCAEQLGNQQVIEDPNVSVFNVHRFFFLDVLTRACAEYINEIALTPGADSLDDPVPFIAKAEANVDFAWICHFAQDAGFLVLDFLQSVRGNASKTLDILWREFFASAHSGTANKTQYVIMAILRVFWGKALTPELDALYHEIRTIPSGVHDGCGVGWDWEIELLNAAIKGHVAQHVSEAQINNFVADWPLIESVMKRLRDLRRRNWSGKIASHTANATNDVNRLKEIFRRTIGRTWAEATSRNRTPHVTKGPQRQKLPWVEVRNVMRRGGDDAPHAYIRKHLTEYTPFFSWRA